MVERAEQQHDVEGPVCETAQIARVAETRGEVRLGQLGGDGARLLDVQRDDVDELHAIPAAREAGSVDAGAAADVQHVRRCRRQDGLEQFERADELERVAAFRQPALLEAEPIVGDKRLGVVHRGNARGSSSL